MEVTDQLIDMLQQRREQLIRLLRPHEEAVKQLKGELDEVESLLRRHGELDEPENFLSRFMKGVTLSSPAVLQETALPDRAAEYTVKILKMAFDEYQVATLKVRDVIEMMPPDLRGEYNPDDAVAAEALRAQLRSRQKKFDFIYHNGVVELKNRSLMPPEQAIALANAGLTNKKEPA